MHEPADHEASARGPVVFDLQGAQRAAERGEPDCGPVLQMALAVHACDPGAVDIWLVRPDLPLPGEFEPLVASGRMSTVAGAPVVTACVFHVASASEAVPMRDLHPWRLIGDGTHLVVTAQPSRDAQARANGSLLLRRADATIAIAPGATDWGHAGAQMASLYRRLRASPVRRASERPRRLAMATVLPPVPTGPADSSAALVAELSRAVALTCFTPDGREPAHDTPADLATAAFSVRPLAALPLAWADRDVDRVLVTLANNAWHVPHLSVLDAIPVDVLLLHDVRLVDLYAAAAGDVRDVVARQYGPGRAEAGHIDQQAADRLGIYLSREAARSAGSVVVNSRYAAALLRVDAEVESTVIGLPPRPRPAETWRGQASATIVSPGIVDDAKGSTLLVEALAAPALAGCGARLRFVGEVSAGERDRLSALADGLGVAERVAFTGRVSADAFRREVRDAGLVAAIRRSTQGESSGAIVDSLALGAPAIVTAIGAHREIPAHCVAFVPALVAPADLAARAAALLSDAGRRAELGAAARAFSRGSDAAAVAQRLLSVVARR